MTRLANKQVSLLNGLLEDFKGDPELIREAGADFFETLADEDVQVRIPMITDPRGVLKNYR